ncbi:MAG: DUF4832 domain-containing protein [Saprospiraceae bacterium]
MKHALLLPLLGFFSGITASLPAQQTTTVVYDESTEDFPNPERGFYHYTATYSGEYQPLDTNVLKAWRNLHQPPGAGYSIYSTLVFRYFFLEDFKSGLISPGYLDAMSQDFEAARQAGVKLIVRFAYTEDPDAGGCTFCPPYGDAPLSIVLLHIGQLKPLLQANADVIAVVQMGFIGIWGENYFTDYFGDASQPPYGLSAQNWLDRKTVADSLLSALPATRCIQVRHAQMKQKFVYGANAPLSAAPLQQNEAWQNTAKARIGFHNDCFLASPDDYGTFYDYDINGAGADTASLKPYWAADALFVPVGGETCNDWNPYSNCSGEPGGGANAEMARLHYSYLNADYNHAVNNDWVSGGCMNAIRQQLGYRLVLQKGEYTTAAQPGKSVFVKIELKNVGFAAPFNPRRLRLLLRNQASGEVYAAELPDDPRGWLPGGQTRVIQHTLCLPANLPEGNYGLLLHLADPYASLTGRPEYAIRLANSGAVWEPGTGYNNLLHTLVVSADGGGEACDGGLSFSSGTVAINEPFANGGNWLLYPNPAGPEVYVQAPPANAGPVDYVLYNVLGEVIDQGRFDLSGAAPAGILLPSHARGMFFLRLLLPGGHEQVFRFEAR